MAQSEETKKKMSKAHGGKKRSKESIEKTANALRGRKLGPLSTETKKKLSESLTGRKFSLDTRLKMSRSQKGRKNLKNVQESRDWPIENQL